MAVFAAATEAYNSALYSTVAQVLPVIFVLLAVNLRLFREPEHQDAYTSVYVIVIFLLLVAGEFYALVSLAEQEPPSTFGEIMLVTSLGVGGMMLLLWFLMPHLSLVGAHDRFGGGVFLYIAGGMLLIVARTFKLVTWDLVWAFVVVVPFLTLVVIGGVQDVPRMRGRRTEPTSDDERASRDQERPASK